MKKRKYNILNKILVETDNINEITENEIAINVDSDGNLELIERVDGNVRKVNSGNQIKNQGEIDNIIEIGVSYLTMFSFLCEGTLTPSQDYLEKIYSKFQNMDNYLKLPDTEIQSQYMYSSIIGCKINLKIINDITYEMFEIINNGVSDDYRFNSYEEFTTDVNGMIEQLCAVYENFNLCNIGRSLKKSNILEELGDVDIENLEETEILELLNKCTNPIYGISAYTISTEYYLQDTYEGKTDVLMNTTYGGRQTIYTDLFTIVKACDTGEYKIGDSFYTKDIQGESGSLSTFNTMSLSLDNKDIVDIKNSKLYKALESLKKEEPQETHILD